IPKGVFNIVHGGRECVDALLTHPKVKAISFVGSTPIARYIFEVGTKHGKRVQSNGGAKNFVFLMPDADIENSVRGLVEAAYGCAGHRWPWPQSGWRAQWLLPRGNHPGRGPEWDDRGEGGNFWPCPQRDALRGPRFRHRSCQPFTLWKRRFYFHPFRKGGPRIQTSYS